MILQAVIVAAVAFFVAFNKNEKNVLLDKILPKLHLQRRSRIDRSLEIS